MLSGFSRDELALLRANADAIWPTGAAADAPPPRLLRPTRRLLARRVADIAADEWGHGDDAYDDESDYDDDPAEEDACHRHGRVVFFLSGPARQHAAGVNAALVEAFGVPPAIVAAAQEELHAGLPLGGALAAVRAAHARHHQLVRPVATAPPHMPPPLPAPPTLAMNAVLDRADAVLTSRGGERADEAAVVVIDGLLSEDERGELLDWLTAPGHDHSGPPPEGKWERACVDRAGDAATWGLGADTLRALLEAPPPAAVALQARVAALYPEWTVAHMPSEALLDADADDDEQPLSAHVANAVVYGDPCQWHCDADPARFPPGAPFVEHAGYYYNREPGKPLLVTLMAYLNDDWPPERFAETLFADPETGTGLMVQPRPGR